MANNRLNYLNNFEIDKRVAEKYLNKPPKNDLDFGFLNLDMPRYHFQRPDHLPYVRPTMENAILGKNIDAQIPQFKHQPNSKMDFNTFDKVNNIYPFHQNQHRQTERVTRTYDNISSKLFGIPDFKIEIETNEGKMAGIYGKTNKQIMVDNWRGDNEVKGAMDSMLADPRFDEIINSHITKPPPPPPPGRPSIQSPPSPTTSS